MSDDASGTRGALASRVRDFYERYPYPPPADDLSAYRRSWNDHRRRAETCLFWPSQPYRDDRSILVAGCGTIQAAHYAVRWPNARVVGIDVSEASIAATQELKLRYALSNLELRRVGIERAEDLGETFEYVVCTGVLHHLPDPHVGLGALRQVLAPDGALHLMVYAPYGRAGIYMLQDYCRRLDVGTDERDVRDLAASLKSLPQDHPIVPLLRNSPDFSTMTGLADALLHPNDRAYSVPQLFEMLERAQLEFGRWIRQAPYDPSCGAIASTPHAALLAALKPKDRYAAMELFRGTMVRHSVIAYGSAGAALEANAGFQADAWRRYVPIRMAGAITVRDHVPEGAYAVLINRSHTFSDLYMPISEVENRLVSLIDGERTAGDILNRAGNPDGAGAFFYRLWLWDQVAIGR